MAINARALEKGPAPAPLHNENTPNPNKLSNIKVGADNSSEIAKKRVKTDKLAHLRNNKVQLMSRVTDKGIITRNKNVSSYPNIAEQNNPGMRTNKKMKKSVLTLPNVRAPTPRKCTASDINDSEYSNKDDDNFKTNAKTFQIRKPRPKLNKMPLKSSDLECSSTETLKDYSGDGIRELRSNIPKKPPMKEDLNTKDMMTVFRNMDKFQLRPSPRLPDDRANVLPKKKSTFLIKKKIHNGRRLIETCRTEEVSYVARFEIGSPPSPASSDSDSVSISGITVIETNFRNKNAAAKQKENQFNKTQNNLKTAVPRNSSTIHERMQNRVSLKNNLITSKEGNKLLSPNLCNTANKFKENNHKDFADPNLRKNTQIMVAGRTKMVLENIQNEFLSDIDNKIKRKPRLVTTMSSNPLAPKLNIVDIKKKLNQIKYPIIILGKDQLSSGVPVVCDVSPQFDGLDKHIWPYMAEWANNDKSKRCTNYLQRNKNMNVKKNIDMYINHTTLIDDKTTNIDIEKKKFEDKKEMQKSGRTGSPIPKKSKPIRNFNDKMLRILYKKPSFDYVVDKELGDIVTKKMDACTNPIFESKVNKTPKSGNKIFTIDRPQDVVDPRRVGAKPVSSRVKGKWDFIENVIKKIRNGVYYSQENSPKSTKKRHVQDKLELVNDLVTKSSGFIPCNEESIQVPTRESGIDNGNDSQQNDVDWLPRFTDKPFELSNISDFRENHDKIPGFDDKVDILSELEINTLNMNQIAVKHRLSNVVVQFDVVLPNKLNGFAMDMKKTFSFIPVSITEKIKIFKCNTTILNAVLPAELCSMVPKLMRDFIQSKAYLCVPKPNTVKHSVDLPLVEINELRSVNSFNVLGPCNIPQIICEISPTLMRVLAGTYAIRRTYYCRCCYYKKYIRSEEHNLSDVSQLLPELSSPIPLCLVFVSPLDFIMPPSEPADNFQSCIESSNSTAVQLYVDENQLSPLTNGYANFKEIMQEIRTYYSFNLSLYIPRCNNLLWLNCDLVLDARVGLEKTLVIRMGYIMKVGIINEDYKNVVMENQNDELRQLSKVALAVERYNKLNKNYKSLTNENSKSPTRKKFESPTRNKSKSPIQLYSEKLCTPLSKITNLDEFFGVLSSDNTISYVFDGHHGDKIMASVEKIKEWTSDITPGQAMLILLLANKKDTRNLKRSVLLQSIALKRITKATELDKEIEVDVTKNKCDDIPHLSAPEVTKNLLFDELCRIAETTALENQKPFNDDSKKLLKSLLEKKEKVNPSYLKVMARYVGMGLMKTPCKTQ